LTLSLGGIVIGAFFGAVACLWIKNIYFDSILVVNITLVFSYVVFYFADHLVIYGNRFSGIISVLTFGLVIAVLGKNNL
jgi:NhaP-type Na+/H+ or K+/H+ antiporter